MSTYCKKVQADTLGAGTADGDAAVGTITLRPNPGVIIGFIVNGTANINTTAEAYQTQFKFDLGEVGLKELRMSGPCNVGEGIGTQSGGFAGAARILGAKIPFNGNERIDVTFGHHGPAPTAGSNVMGAVLYSQPPHPPPEWFQRFPMLYPLSGGDTEANAAVTAVSTDITDLEIPSFSKFITGFSCGAAQDAVPRTGEDLVLGIDFTSTFPDFEPQEYPFLWKYPNLLGTIVGKGISLPTVTMPAWIPTFGVSGQVTPSVELVTLVTDAHSVTADVFYTKMGR